jgi:hypothetical protein
MPATTRRQERLPWHVTLMRKLLESMRSSKLWRLWAKALGEKHGRTDREADTIACIRTLIFISYLVTNIFIISGVIRHWDGGTKRLPELNQSV